MIPKLKLFAESLLPFILWFKDNPDDKDTKYVVSRLVRFSSDSPEVHGIPYMYSLGALEAAKEKGVENPEERLKWIRWKEQTLKRGLRDDGRKGGVFHQEHIVPISQIAKLLYELEEPSVENIYEVLLNNLKVAWILKTEQRILDSSNRSGIRTPEELTELKIYIKGFNI